MLSGNPHTLRPSDYQSEARIMLKTEIKGLERLSSGCKWRHATIKLRLAAASALWNRCAANLRAEINLHYCENQPKCGG